MRDGVDEGSKASEARQFRINSNKGEIKATATYFTRCTTIPFCRIHAKIVKNFSLETGVGTRSTQMEEQHMNSSPLKLSLCSLLDYLMAGRSMQNESTWERQKWLHGAVSEDRMQVVRHEDKQLGGEKKLGCKNRWKVPRDR